MVMSSWLREWKRTDVSTDETVWLLTLNVSPTKTEPTEIKITVAVRDENGNEVEPDTVTANTLIASCSSFLTRQFGDIRYSYADDKIASLIDFQVCLWEQANDQLKYGRYTA